MVLFFMKISRELAIQILKYCAEHKDFYFPFLVVCKEYTPEDDDFVEIEPSEWEMIAEDDIYQTFQLWENLQGLKQETIELLAKGFIEVMTEESLEKHIYILAKKYRKQWRKEICGNEKIEEYELNEFIEGKADAFEDCLFLVRKYQNVPDYKNSKNSQ